MKQFIVSVRPCRSYEPTAVSEALTAVLRDLGGIGAFVKPGQTVLLKPNLLAGEPPERAVTTHPEVVKAALDAFKSAGADVIVGDSPGIGSCRGVAEKAGVAGVVRSGGGTMGRFDRVTNIGRGAGRHFPVADEVRQAGLVVNLPKLKTHRMMVLSGAVKNLFGCVVGLRKPGYHFECQGTREFAALLLDLAAAVSSGLTIMDAVVAMDGPGPRNGRARSVGYLLGARDSLALDFVAADLAGLPMASVPHLRLAAEMGLAAADPDRRAVVGVNLDDCRIKDFVSPPHLRSNDFSMPSFLHRLARWSLSARPSISGACTNCGVCAAICPAGAIAAGRSRARIARRQCIKCYCCEEMCSQKVIVLRQGIIGRLWPWG